VTHATPKDHHVRIALGLGTHEVHPESCAAALVGVVDAQRSVTQHLIALCTADVDRSALERQAFGALDSLDHAVSLAEQTHLQLVCACFGLSGLGAVVRLEKKHGRK
jgi:hypothetical protein